MNIHKPPARKQKEFLIRIVGFETVVKRNEYRRSKDDSEPMLFEVNFAAQDQYTNGRVYFKHSLQFMRHLRNWGVVDKFEREESEFVRIGKAETCNEIYVKVKAEEIIRVKALWEEKISRNGSTYLSLTRVQRVAQDTLL